MLIFVVQSSDGQAVGDVNVTMSYDTASLELLSGDGFTADGSGNLTYTGSGSSAELRATMQFRALLAGSTSITVNSSTASVASGETLNLEQGSSAVTIEAAADGTTSVRADRRRRDDRDCGRRDNRYCSYCEWNGL